MGIKKEIESRFSAKELRAIEHEYEKETSHLRQAHDSLNKSLAEEIKKLMLKRGMGVNEFRRQLKLSSRTVDQLLHGKGNPTFSTIARLAAFSGKKPVINWE